MVFNTTAKKKPFNNGYKPFLNPILLKVKIFNDDLKTTVIK